MAVEQSITIMDSNTLNGFGIVTIDLTNNTHLKDKTYYYDLNTDYYIYSYIENGQLIALFISCDNDRIAKTDLTIQTLYGPFDNKTDAWEAFLLCQECNDLDKNKYIYVENVNKKTNDQIIERGYNINNINIYMSFAYILK